MACPIRQKSVEPSTSTCPNSDPNFNKIIGNRTPEERSNLYIVCVLVRSLLYYGVYMYRNVPATRYIVGAASAASAIQLSGPTENKQWWSKKFQLVMSILVLIACIVNKMDIASYLLFTSLAGGIIQRMFAQLC